MTTKTFDYSTVKIGDLSEQYAAMQLEMAKRCYRVIRISDRYSAMCYLQHHPLNITTKLMDAATSMEVKLVDNLTAQEHLAYGRFLSTIQQWLDDGMKHECPIESDQASLTKHRTATGIDAE